MDGEEVRGKVWEKRSRIRGEETRNYEEKI